MTFPSVPLLDEHTLGHVLTELADIERDEGVLSNENIRVTLREAAELTEAQIDQVLQAYGRLCAMCGKDESHRSLELQIESLERTRAEVIEDRNRIRFELGTAKATIEDKDEEIERLADVVRDLQGRYNERVGDHNRTEVGLRARVDALEVELRTLKGGRDWDVAQRQLDNANNRARKAEIHGIELERQLRETINERNAVQGELASVSRSADDLLNDKYDVQALADILGHSDPELAGEVFATLAAGDAGHAREAIAQAASAYARQVALDEVQSWLGAIADLRSDVVAIEATRFAEGAGPPDPQS